MLWKEAGCSSELDYTEQTFWLLFLKYLDDLEQERATEAELEGRTYSDILDPPYRWERWAAPKDRDGRLDHNKALTGDDLVEFVDRKLFPIDAPNIIHTNTLAENLADIQEKDRYDVVPANPPFGGKECKEVQQNFPIRTGETAFLFLQHFIKILRAGGRAGVVIKNTFLSNSDNASVSLRKLLLESSNLHTVLDCPSGTFQGAGVKTVVLFFEKGAPTRKIWYYQLDPGRTMGKTTPLNDADLTEFVALQKDFADSPKSWSLDVGTVDTATYDLSVKNPNGGEAVAHRSPVEILDEIAVLDAESAAVLAKIRGLL
ncbi:N-6 DNA methylase [Thiocapsa sp.]|uniref:class I SAM-dependent DNA methyltransferase n=1 Tax=Thiocapsa sp. TaxID=2024551 RepID=UPI002CBCD72E|nr:N-6 DNA methylase [Thiocapsa sp.]HSO81125.1 N-6 DNA methylase [Thiocapsa sp.]